jgi:aldehyde reductase
MEELNIKREEIFVTSKLWNVFHHPDDVETAFKLSLNALGLDYLDLYLIHWPTAFLRGTNMFPKNEDGSMIVSRNDLPIRSFIQSCAYCTA